MQEDESFLLPKGRSFEEVEGYYWKEDVSAAANDKIVTRLRLFF